MSDDATFAYNKKPNRIYFSSEFKVADYRSGKVRPMRYISQVFKEDDRPQFVEIKGETVIRSTSTGRQQISAKFFTDTRGIDVLVLQRFTRESGRPHEKSSFSLLGKEIQALLDLALLVRTADLPEGGDKMRLNAENLQNFSVTPSAARALLRSDPKLINEVLKHELTERDVVAVAYRRNQLNRFRKLLDDSAYFATQRAELKVNNDEAVWQTFFEQNPWIFGYGLFFVFTSGFIPEKLEQYVAGASVEGAGKRVDALLRTRGIVSSLCFAEIKTHTTSLLEDKAHRSDTWAPSRQLTAAVAQVHKTVDRAEQLLRRRVERRDEEGNPTDDPAYLIRPRSVVVVGSLKEFKGDRGVNEPKYSSFELFRRQLVAPEVITFDELYERARFIVDQAEGA